MRHRRQALISTAAVLTAVLVAACSSGGNNTSATNAGSYGECEVYGDAGTINLQPTSKGTLTVQTTLPSPGWWKGDTPDSIVGGYEFCLAANIAHRAGLKDLKIDNVSFDALVAGQTEGYDLAMAQISVTPEREKVLTFSAPYFESQLGVLAPADSDVSEANIRDKMVGVQVGTTAVQWAQDELQPGNEPQLFQDTGAMVTAVSSGIVDVAVQDTAIMLGFAKNSGGSLKVVGQYESGENYAAIYPKGSTNADTISAAIESMRKDGTLDKLSAKWLGPELGGDPAAVPVWSLQ